MSSNPAIQEFLGLKRIAMIGLSRDSKDYSRLVYELFAANGVDVVPVNPNTESIGNKKCYASVEAIEGPVEGAFVTLPPNRVAEALQACKVAGINRVWLRNAVGQAATQARADGMTVIEDACPMMYVGPVGFPHNFHRWVVKLSGKY